jgi:ketosteroid isomerase-like protein
MSKKPMKQPGKVKSMIFVFLSILIVTGLPGCSVYKTDPVSPEVLDEVKSADRSYATAWLTSDREEVMNTLTPDAVIVPSGMPAIVGTEVIRQFWWPSGGPPTKVTEFTLVQHDAGGHGDLGFVRGTFSLGFVYDGTTYSGGGEYISLLRRTAEVSWKISHRMWSDGPRNEDD